jgi:uncharacterized RDD family membrane protein YckC
MDDPLTSENPYAPPKSPTAMAGDGEVIHYEPASGGKRFLHLIVDQFTAVIALSAFVFVVGIMGVVMGDEGLVDRLFGDSSGLLGNLMGIGVMGAYYLLMEGLFGRTLGKMITGTRVVNWKTGQKPGIGALVGRTLARFVPFEAFSFLGSEPGGWHDRWSGTMVVDLKKPLSPKPTAPTGPRFFPGR